MDFGVLIKAKYFRLWWKWNWRLNSHTIFSNETSWLRAMWASHTHIDRYIGMAVESKVPDGRVEHKRRRVHWGAAWFRRRLICYFWSCEINGTKPLMAMCAHHLYASKFIAFHTNTQTQTQSRAFAHLCCVYIWRTLRHSTSLSEIHIQYNESNYAIFINELNNLFLRKRWSFAQASIVPKCWLCIAQWLRATANPDTQRMVLGCGTSGYRHFGNV